MREWSSALSRGRFALVILGLAAVSAGSWAYVFGGRLPGHARLVLPTYPLDLGEGKTGQIIDGTFEIRNGGLVPLHFEITPSCGCSEMRPTSGTLGPRESRQVFVGIRLGTEETKTVYATIQSNDPDRASAVYMISASCPSPLQAVPAKVDFGRFVPDGTREATVHVQGPKGGPLKDPEVVRFLSTNPHFRVERVGVESGELVLRVSLDKELPLGHHGGAIELRVPGESNSVDVLLTAEVLANINVAPASLILQKDPETGALREASLMVWCPDGMTLGSLDKTEAPNGVTIEETGKADDRVRRFRVRFAGETIPEASRICFQFENVAESAVVRLVPPTDRSRSGSADVAAPGNSPTLERNRP